MNTWRVKSSDEFQVNKDITIHRVSRKWRYSPQIVTSSAKAQVLEEEKKNIQ